MNELLCQVCKKQNRDEEQIGGGLIRLRAGRGGDCLGQRGHREDSLLDSKVWDQMHGRHCDFLSHDLCVTFFS